MLRIGTVWGPLVDPESPFFHVPPYISAVLRGDEPQQLYADDGGDACYAPDAGRAIALLTTAPTLQHDSYNVSSGRPFTNRELADALEAAVPGLRLDLLSGRRRGPGSDPYLDITRLTRDTGFAPDFDVASAVADDVAWRADNPAERPRRSMLVARLRQRDDNDRRSPRWARRRDGGRRRCAPRHPRGRVRRAWSSVGEPGIGKTRLLAELAVRADARGCTVLTGSASELDRDLPFWVFVDALDEYVAGLDPQLVASLRDDVRVELAQVLPSLADHAADGGPVLQDERYRAHRAVRELLERLAVRRPLVLTLDDVHWADPASVELVAALLRSPPDAAFLLVVAGRPRQLPERLAAALHRAERQGGATRLELTGLAPEAAVEMLGEQVGRERADALYADSGGNPFYLQQLARADGAGG